MTGPPLEPGKGGACPVRVGIGWLNSSVPPMQLVSVVGELAVGWLAPWLPDSPLLRHCAAIAPESLAQWGEQGETRTAVIAPFFVSL